MFQTMSAFFRILIGYLSIDCPVKLQYWKIYRLCCVCGCHKRNIHNIKNPQVCFVPWCVLVKFHENLPILHTPLIHLKRWYSCKKLLRVFAIWRVVNNCHAFTQMYINRICCLQPMKWWYLWRSQRVIFSGIWRQ